MHYDNGISLSGFNNLTKALSFNIYDFCTADSMRERAAFFKYVNEKYNASKITEALKKICNIINANVISVSDQNYNPWGASSLVLMSDYQTEDFTTLFTKISSGVNLSNSVNMHLDKSHICAHTYPEYIEGGSICSIRIDIDIATCGTISPLNALNYMFNNFESDVVVIDYVVRGFTRDKKGRRIYMDHPLSSIKDYIDPKILEEYYCLDIYMQQDNIWQTKMLRTKLDESSYFLDPVDLNNSEIRKKLESIKKEMRGVLHMLPE